MLYYTQTLANDSRVLRRKTNITYVQNTLKQLGTHYQEQCE